MQPHPNRPHMPGYGIRAAAEGMLDWAEARRRIDASRNFWVATVRPDGRPHVMPVWAVWHDDALWFSSSLRSRKIRNLLADPRCTVTTEDGERPVVIDGTAELVADLDAIGRFLATLNAKYDTEYGIDFLDPKVNASVRVRPQWAFALTEEDFSGSPTTWRW